MSEIFIKHMNDYNIFTKDCEDFAPLEDGTITKEKKYCNLSFQCRQTGYYSEYCDIYDKKGVLIERDYLCTGKLMKHKDEILIDEEAR